MVGSSLLEPESERAEKAVFASEAPTGGEKLMVIHPAPDTAP
jgi:hypothetical protein